MTQPLSRRELLATAGAGLAIAATAGQRSAHAEALTGGIKITMPVGELTDENLAFVAYLGVEYVTTGGPASPTYTPEGRVVQARPNDPAPPWKDADLRRMKETVERAGLKLGNVMLHDFRRAILGRPGGDEDIELVKESIRAAGRVGIPIVEYNWYALRAMGGYYEEPGRGGSRLAAHDYARSKDLPVLDDVGTHGAADLWTRYERFLKAVVPVAEQANVRLAVHPNDPPPPRYRGTDQILGSVDGLKRVCETVKSPANGITLDVGVTREMGCERHRHDQVVRRPRSDQSRALPQRAHEGAARGLCRDVHRRRRQRHAGLPARAARDRVSAPAASRSRADAARRRAGAAGAATRSVR